MTLRSGVNVYESFVTANKNDDTTENIPRPMEPEIVVHENDEIGQAMIINNDVGNENEIANTLNPKSYGGVL